MEIGALDIRGNRTSIQQFHALKKALLKDRKYQEDLLYRGFDGNNIPVLLKTGQDTNNKYLFCAREIDIIDAFTTSANVFMYASQRPLPTITVFYPTLSRVYSILADKITEYSLDSRSKLILPRDYASLA